MTSKKLFIIAEITLAFIVAVLTALFLMGRSNTKKKNVTVIANGVKDESRSAFRYGLRQAAKDFGLELSYVDASDTRDADAGKALLDRELSLGVDALIIEPGVGTDTWDIYSEASKKVPIMFVGNTLFDTDVENISVTEADQTLLGRALATKMLESYDNHISGKRIGLVGENLSTPCMMERRAGVMDVLRDTGCEVIYNLATSDDSADPETSLASQPRVDILLALDTATCEAAGEVSFLGNFHHATLFGIGDSMKSVSFLDKKAMLGLVVPDSFMTGYQSVSEIAQKLRSRFYTMQSPSVTYKPLSRSDLFSPANQEMLFAMGQSA
ncbi:MAG: substrate-binding domain-containing protein [Lachnospiraceae bacterium]|nr:substrate-binding domain-containing protein [Lachnospiraceae bacterium]